MTVINPVVAGESRWLAPILRGIKETAQSYGNFVFGVEQSDSFAKHLGKAVYGVKDPETKKYVGGKGFNEFGTSFKEAWTKSKAELNGKTFGTVLKDSFNGISEEFKALKDLPKFFGEGGKLSKGLGIFGKRMPLIGNVLVLATSLPNIYHAFTDKENGGGIATGIKEIGKTAVSLGGFAAGAAIGQALIPIPFVGGIIGGIVGGWIAGKITGEEFDEKKERKAEEKVAVNPNLNQIDPTLGQPSQIYPGAYSAISPPNPYQINPRLLNPGINPSITTPYPGTMTYPPFNSSTNYANPFATPEARYNDLLSKPINIY